MLLIYFYYVFFAVFTKSALKKIFYFISDFLFQDTLVKSMLKQQQQPYGVNVLTQKPDSRTLFSKVFTHLYLVLNFKNHDYPRVTETVSFALMYSYRI